MERPQSAPAARARSADPALDATVRDPAYAGFAEEGRIGGIDLLTRLYFRS